MTESNTMNHKILWAGALIALIVGVGTGLWAWSASLGVWLGFWEFGKGFEILGAANPYTGWIALFCLIEAVSLLVMAKVWKSDKGVKFFSMALIGALAAAIAWYIPTTFSAPEGQSYPPIHDISTDTVSPPAYVAVLPLRADAPNTTVYEGSVIAEQQLVAYPDIAPQLFNDSTEEVFARALAAVDTMGWELVASVPEEGRIEATATTFWFRFKDDVVIRIQTEGSQTRLDARSLSRVGRGDVGANAIRLRAFFELL